jgi:hypothetical protein
MAQKDRFDSPSPPKETPRAHRAASRPAPQSCRCACRSMRSRPANKCHSILNFSYVCPEPVLVKMMHFVYKWRKKWRVSHPALASVDLKVHDIGPVFQGGDPKEAQHRDTEIPCGSCAIAHTTTNGNEIVEYRAKQSRVEQNEQLISMRSTRSDAGEVR